ncbi:hypothetical protein SAMN04488540_111110 [Ferrimonas sediminum]|uniref:Polyketide cyclase / dehydrase and lipid transport n=1 Tax=Ferrimonas sediminum TaxID=718193 RepID=A0A1G8VN68_9GAMM|nr:hypothetical protein [Ferrimonas sediminum]SDJ67526.1 hypothetical protein SAMN04488540_111110 [Ferrimonas sediminum]
MIVRPRQSRAFSGEIRSNRPVEEVFPLFCPVREREWVPGWDPLLVWTNSGAIEPDCVFTTQDPAGHAVWYVVQASADQGVLELLKTVADHMATRILIRVFPAPEGSLIQLNYRYTSLSPRGASALENLTESYWAQFMQRWQKAMERYFSQQRRTA